MAAVYASVGLGGGSSYTALLAIFGAGPRLIPPVSLGLNVIVTLVGALTFGREGHLRLRLVAPLLLVSVPLSYLGGSLEVPARLFHWLLLGTLALVAARIYLADELSLRLDPGPVAARAAVVVLGGAIGLVGGVVGIGGGIYLVPLLLLLDLATEKEAAAAGTVFTGANSLTALTAHLRRGVPELGPVLPLAGAVLVGGVVGAHLGAARFSAATVRRVLGGVVVLAVALLTRRLVF